MPRAHPLPLDDLALLHGAQGLLLVTSDRQGMVYLHEENRAAVDDGPSEGQGRAVVTELIRLARLGQCAEDLAHRP